MSVRQASVGKSRQLRRRFPGCGQQKPSTLVVDGGLLGMRLSESLQSGSIQHLYSHRTRRTSGFPALISRDQLACLPPGLQEAGRRPLFCGGRCWGSIDRTGLEEGLVYTGGNTVVGVRKKATLRDIEGRSVEPLGARWLTSKGAGSRRRNLLMVFAADVEQPEVAFYSQDNPIEHWPPLRSVTGRADERPNRTPAGAQESEAPCGSAEGA